jgi:hypothetical protein
LASPEVSPPTLLLEASIRIPGVLVFMATAGSSVYCERLEDRVGNQSGEHVQFREPEAGLASDVAILSEDIVPKTRDRRTRNPS